MWISVALIYHIDRNVKDRIPQAVSLAIVSCSSGKSLYLFNPPYKTKVKVLKLQVLFRFSFDRSINKVLFFAQRRSCYK